MEQQKPQWSLSPLTLILDRKGVMRHKGDPSLLEMYLTLTEPQVEISIFSVQGNFATLVTDLCFRFRPLPFTKTYEMYILLKINKLGKSLSTR